MAKNKLIARIKNKITYSKQQFLNPYLCYYKKGKTLFSYFYYIRGELFMVEIYRNAPLRQALCVFEFDSSQDWDLTIPGVLYENVRSEFPKKQVGKTIKLLIEGKEGKVTSKPTDTYSAMRFFREDKSAFLEISPHKLSINHLRPYSGWDNFKSLILDSLNKYIELAGTSHIKKASLRYINGFEVHDDPFEISEYFTFEPSLPVDKPLQNFFTRSELIYEDVQSVFVVTLGTQEVKDDDSYIVLDLEFKTEVINLNLCSDWLEKVHQHIGEVFELCITEKMRERLRGD